MTAYGQAHPTHTNMHIATYKCKHTTTVTHMTAAAVVIVVGFGLGSGAGRKRGQASDVVLLMSQDTSCSVHFSC